MPVDANTFVPVAAIAAIDADPATPHAGLLAALHALADANRLRIFTLLREGERCVCDIETGVHLPQNLVSHHLRVLRESGLIRGRREGRWMYYAVDAAQLAALRPLFHALLDPTNVDVTPVRC